MKDEEKYLEDEMEKFGERWPYPASFDGYDKDWVDELSEECAKHFYELGKKKQKEKDEKEQADLFTIVALDAAQRAKEQMMKDAVEGEISSVDVGDDSYVKSLKMSELQKAIRNYNVGDKVRVIVCKKED